MTERINHPGIIFPDPPRRKVKVSESMSEPPDWGMTTRDAARLLGISMSGVRAYLARHKVRCVSVKGVLYWNRHKVNSLANSRPDLVEGLPNWWVSTREAEVMLGVVRARLYYLVTHGRLTERKFRVRGRRGIREVGGYSIIELERLHHERQARLTTYSEAK